MSRVLITGGTGPLGAAIAKRLLADPAYDVRISDRRDAPPWMREGCEIHRGDLRVAAEALAAAKGCSHAIHLAGFEHSTPEGENGACSAAMADPPHTLLEYESALHGAVIRAAIDRRLERFVYVSSPLVLEQAEKFPTPEEHLAQCPPPRSVRGFARLIGERSCAAAHAEHGLEYAICRPFGAYGATDETNAAAPASLVDPASELDRLIELAVAGELPLLAAGASERTLTPTHVEDLAEGIVATLGSPAGANEDFNIAAERELSLAEIAQIAWQAGGAERDELSLEQPPPGDTKIPRSAPSVQKAHKLLGWRARTEAMQGIAAAATAARERAAHERAPAAVSE